MFTIPLPKHNDTDQEDNDGNGVDGDAERYQPDYDDGTRRQGGNKSIESEVCAKSSISQQDGKQGVFPSSDMVDGAQSNENAGCRLVQSFAENNRFSFKHRIRRFFKRCCCCIFTNDVE